MTAPRSLLVAALAALSVSCASSAPAPIASTDAAPPSLLIKIRDTGVSPDPIAVPAGTTIHWANEGSRRSTAVFLPDATLEAASCGELRPAFARVAGGVRSERLDRRADRVRLPCALPPGSYAFQVEYFDELRRGALARAPELLDNPLRVETGQIVVRARTPDAG